MLVAGMLYKLVLAIVSNSASVTHIGLLIGVSSFMVVSISNRREPFSAMFALVGLFTSMNTHVHKQVPSLVELFLTIATLEIGLNRLSDALVLITTVKRIRRGLVSFYSFLRVYTNVVTDVVEDVLERLVDVVAGEILFTKGAPK